VPDAVAARPDGSGAPDGAPVPDGSLPSRPLAPPAGALPPPRVPRVLNDAAAWSWRVLVVVAATAVVVFILVRLRVLVFPLFAALLLTALLRPLTVRLRGRGVPHAIAAVVTLLLGLALLAGVGALVSRQAASQFDDLGTQVRGGVAEIRDYLTGPPLRVDEEQLNSLGDRLRDAGRTNQEQITQGVVTGATLAAEIVTGVILALFATFFFLFDGEGIWRWFTSLFPRASRARVHEAGSRAWTTLSGYIRGTVFVAFVDALFIGLALVLLGVPLAFSLALITFLGGFIPIVGATVAGIFAVLVALVAKGPIAALIIAGVVVAVQQLEGHILQPLVLGRAVALHPLAIALSIAAGAILAGIPGAVIAVPVVAMINTVASYLFARTDEGEEEPPPPDAGALAAGARAG
jgi:predicted PurR-regulated permease PerM